MESSETVQSYESVILNCRNFEADRDEETYLYMNMSGANYVYLFLHNLNGVDKHIL